MIIVVMGVAGSGKTTVGGALARELHWRFVDADDLHPPENIARMRAAIPLTEDDREPWLRALAGVVSGAAAAGEDLVLACSALRAHFRDELRAAARELHYVFLRATPELLAARLVARRNHFMPPELLASQLDALEEPAEEPAFDASLRVDVLVSQIRQALAL